MQPGESLSLFIKAVAFAAHKHRLQRRKDSEASPYINHPIALANVLANEGFVLDQATLCAAVLHDTVEDTATTQQEIAAAFGDEVATLVMLVTDDKSLPKDARKQLQIEHAAGLPAKAKLIKLADKICNVRDMLDSPPKDWTLTRKQAYLDWSALVVSGLRGTNAELESIFDGLYARRLELR
jgi:GTP diphosphokinase / guanosine-3',5'-bis(diphosphate) 3'-diphosphatase